ncbi:hypothetical protein Lal_00001236 [Lupinus albus]|nr:hypothetical protein Lal_00001236 [Lupinus albus]
MDHTDGQVQHLVNSQQKSNLDHPIPLVAPDKTNINPFKHTWIDSIVRTLTPNVAVHLLVMGLLPSLLKMELFKDTIHTVEDIRSIAQQFINLEETPNEHLQHNHFRHDLPRPHKQPKYVTYTPLNANRSKILQEVMSIHLIKLPKPNPSKKI